MRNRQKMYRMEDREIGFLVGKKVIRADINKENDLVILHTESGPIYLSWVGDCCAHCFLSNASGTEALNNATILSAENAEWVRQEKEEFEVLETMGTKIKTDKGYVDLISHVEHNGYYGGTIKVSDDEPIDAYSSPRFDEGELPDMAPLKDF